MENPPPMRTVEILFWIQLCQVVIQVRLSAPGVLYLLIAHATKGTVPPQVTLLFLLPPRLLLISSSLLFKSPSI